MKYFIIIFSNILPKSTGERIWNIIKKYLKIWKYLEIYIFMNVYKYLWNVSVTLLRKILKYFKKRLKNLFRNISIYFNRILFKFLKTFSNYTLKCRMSNYKSYIVFSENSIKLDYSICYYKELEIHIMCLR